MEYTLRERDGEPERCDSCDSPAPLAEFECGPPFTAKYGRPRRLLCEFCSTTMTSRYTEYPPRDQDHYGLMRAEVWKANAALFNALKHGLDGTRSTTTGGDHEALSGSPGPSAPGDARTALWDAIAELVVACGGSTAHFDEVIANKISAIFDGREGT